MSSYKIKAPKPSFKKLKQEMRKNFMNQVANNVTPINPNNVPTQTAPPAPIEVSAFDDFTNCTTFLRNLVQQIVLPAHVTAPRTKALFDDVRAYLQARLEKEVEQKY
jgi:hypothetical protein